MPTNKQKLGDFGEQIIAKTITCPKCKKEKTLKTLPTNFKCADIVCDFCGYLAQVKSKNVKDINIIPKSILGAAWSPQKKRMDAGIYFPLFLVLVHENKHAIYYLSADLQNSKMFIPRKPLSKDAKRAGWQGYHIDLRVIPDGAIVRLK